MMQSENNLSNKEKEIKVSICCHAYNHEKYIAQTLQGFVSQITDFRFEIIVHDDASTDNTQNIIQEYVDLYPDLFIPIYETENQYSKEKQRITQVMGPKVKGKYVAFCEGDDYWIDEYKLQKQYDILEKNPDCSICVHGVKLIWEDGTELDKADSESIIPRKAYKLSPGIIEKDQIADALWIQGVYPFHTSGYFIRKRAVEDLFNGNVEFVKFMNGDMAILCLGLMNGKFFFLGDIMSYRRVGVPGSWSTRMNAADIQTTINHAKNQIIAGKKFDEFSNYQFHEYIHQHLLVLGFNLTTECYLYNIGNPKEHKQYLKENPLSIKMIRDRKTFQLYIRYLIMRLSPGLYKLLYRYQIWLKKLKSKIAGFRLLMHNRFVR